MKRSFIMTKEENTNTSLSVVDGYVVNIGAITKNNNNDNHHCSFIVSLIDQTTVRITKFLGKIASCALHRRLRESMLSGHGASIINLRMQNEQYFCTASTKVIDKDLEFRPLCVRIQTIESLKNNAMNGLCSIEVKICEVGPETPFFFEESGFKKIQKLKKTLVVGDKTGALELSIWEPNLNQLKCDECYQIKLVKSRLINSQIALSAVTDTSYIKIEDLGTVETIVNSSITMINTSKGRIIQISTIKEEYGCQACGNNNITKQLDCFICNMCQSRIPNTKLPTDDILKITIVNNNREEYSLTVSKAILMSLLNGLGGSDNIITDVANDENCFNSLINLMIEFKFDQDNGIISELKSITANDLQVAEINDDDISK
ncbi:unnamed protein product [Adineta steineri]|uniref:Uncharacterized protein n=1 Tax=Adineta steineri TaxID=433720 RepID=A0A813WWK2_9BILA|nr:unnamed protein product [Adineta steineri]CAF4000652.1 unnamed protein product [Adineta steineri]